MKTYVVKLAVPASRMSDILGLLERDIADVTIAIRDDVAPRPRLNGEARKLLPPPGEKLRMVDAVLAALASGPKQWSELKAAIVAAGYSGNSINSALLRMERAKQVKRVGRQRGAPFQAC